MSYFSWAHLQGTQNSENCGEREDTPLFLLICSSVSPTENYSYILCISQQFGEKSSYVKTREHVEVNLYYQYGLTESLTCYYINQTLHFESNSRIH